MGRTCSMHGTIRNVYNIFVANPEVKRPLGIFAHRRVDNVQMDHKEIGCESVAGVICLKIVYHYLKVV